MAAASTSISPFRTFQKAISGFQSNYCCGGALPPPTAAEGRESPVTITLRWDLAQPNTSHTSLKLDFPVIPTDAPRFDELLKACDPATFGLGGRDVLDESYRKAGKLDRHQFSTNFHPHDYGIVDAVAQVLLPQAIPGILQGREEHRGVVAELYKLNVYSAPAGKFQAHVDTPRSQNQFGSLVVCLPYTHEGGALRVSHKGRDTHFDWSPQSSTTIQWAAFYSDCEHEVLPVTSGHRVTLTYNLYITEQTGAILREGPLLDISMSPLYNPAKAMLEDISFMSRGGVIGFWCTHHYAHTRTGINRMMPYMLKGLDMTIFRMFKALGQHVLVKPVVDMEDLVREETDDPQRCDSDTYSDGEDVGEYSVFDNGQVLVKDFVGTEMHELMLPLSECERRNEIEAIKNAFPLETKFIRWITSRKIEGEIAIARIIYGNEAEMTWNYSNAAILIEVAPAARRVVAGVRVLEEAPPVEGH